MEKFILAARYARPSRQARSTPQKWQDAEIGDWLRSPGLLPRTACLIARLDSLRFSAIATWPGTKHAAKRFL
eukprot:6228700-Pyramimonas_sp.AAC.1